MLQQFTADYFFQTFRFDTPIPVRQARLTDSDLERGNTAGEFVTQTGSTQEIFDGFLSVRINTSSGQSSVEYFTDTGEASMNITFTDGTSLSGVLGLFDFQSFSYGSGINSYLFDQQALAAVGKSVVDIATVDSRTSVDHDLSWADLGFRATGSIVPAPTPDPVPEPEPEPLLNLVQGTALDDRLSGTNGDDLIRGGDGNDRLTGRAGEDTFVFGADARDGNRDRDVITDFNATEDSIVLEDGVQIRNWTERNGNLIVTLEGDRDTIVIQNADSSILANFSVVDDLFMV